MELYEMVEKEDDEMDTYLVLSSVILLNSLCKSHTCVCVCLITVADWMLTNGALSHLMCKTDATQLSGSVTY